MSWGVTLSNCGHNVGLGLGLGRLLLVVGHPIGHEPVMLLLVWMKRAAIRVELLRGGLRLGGLDRLLLVMCLTVICPVKVMCTKVNMLGVVVPVLPHSHWHVWGTNTRRLVRAFYSAI